MLLLFSAIGNGGIVDNVLAELLTMGKAETVSVSQHWKYGFSDNGQERWPCAFPTIEPSFPEIQVCIFGNDKER